jgi:choline dehydrogenase
VDIVSRPSFSPFLPRQKLTDHLLDPCGSCRMGPTIEEGVVNGRLQVHGVRNLRVIDASVFPIIPDARIQNPVYMVAEKAADMIKQDHPALYQSKESLVEKVKGLVL